MHSVEKMGRGVRRRLQRIAQRCPDRNYVRRALALLALWSNGNRVSKAALQVCAARSTVNRWRSLFELYGEDGLRPQARGRCDWKADETVLLELRTLLASTPAEHGYLRTRWSSELLARVLHQRTGVHVHASAVRRWLRRHTECANSGCANSGTHTFVQLLDNAAQLASDSAAGHVHWAAPQTDSLSASR